MLTEPEAAERAEAYNQAHKVLGRRKWRGERIVNGWVMRPLGDDVARWPGVVCLVVLDDERIFLDSTAVPTSELAARYEGLGNGPLAATPVDEATAAARAAEFGSRNLAALGRRDWLGERFGGGWRMVPQGEDLRQRLDLPAVVVLDDGRIFRDSASAPAMYVIERYVAQLAREATQASMGRGGEG